MATVITEECINCGACEPECPNTAIYQAGVEWELGSTKHPPISADIFYIVPGKCTECVGFYDHEACAAVCPVDCCVPDPKIPETEEQLISRSRQLHPDVAMPSDFPSRFRKDAAGGTATSGKGQAAAAEPPAAATAPTPKPDATRAIPQARDRAAAPKAAAATAPAPKLDAAPASATPTSARVEKAVKPPMTQPTPPEAKHFAGELPDDFEELLGRMARRGGAGAGILENTIALMLMPIVGALPLTRLASRVRAGGTVAFDGFYDRQFEGKRERQRRYGEVYRLEDLGRAYLLRFEFPRRVPASFVKEELRIADDMPDYDYELALSNGSLVVRGKVADPQVRKLASGAPSFPPDFTTRIDLGVPVLGFKHRYRDKVLEVILVKQG